MSLLTRTKRKRFLPELVDDFFNAERFFPSEFLNFGRTELVPSANIKETEKDYTIELAAPGLSRKDFHVEIENDVLTISAEKKEESEEEGKNFRRKEFSYNSFSRSFSLPENLATDKIDAKYEDGVLRLLLPKKEVTVVKPRKEIKVS
jgi:HSP20 family protein